jgi:hypothetical protein
MTGNKKLTVVFDIVDEQSMHELYDAHMKGTAICGLRPTCIAKGDCVHPTEDIVAAILDLDPDYSDKKAFKSVHTMAEEYWKLYWKL